MSSFFFFFLPKFAARKVRFRATPEHRHLCPPSDGLAGASVWGGGRPACRQFHTAYAHRRDRALRNKASTCKTATQNASNYGPWLVGLGGTESAWRIPFNELFDAKVIVFRERLLILIMFLPILLPRLGERHSRVGFSAFFRLRRLGRRRGLFHSRAQNTASRP